mgnify:CR=1 FL=1
MPDMQAAAEAEAFIAAQMAKQDSCGGIIECRIQGMPAGIGDPVFEKLNANLAKAICSIGAVKGFEIGDGFSAARSQVLSTMMHLLPMQPVISPRPPITPAAFWAA